jgi:hypothetical protein
MKSPLLAALCVSLVVTAGGSQAQDSTPANWKEKPWLEPQDTAMATFTPDEYAWRLFLAMNWPARATGCGPDTSKKIGDAGPAVWERWAIKTDVFLAGAAKPKPWEELCGAVLVAKALQPTAQLTLARELRAETQGSREFAPPGGDLSNAADEEVRLNEAAFKFVRDQGLYSLTKQRALAAAGVKAIDFPRMGKEVKAHWIVLPNAADHSRYHTGKGDDGRTYGLVALHITTKDLPRWFWATYEHVDNETRWPAEFPGEFAGWSAVPPRDTYACPASNPGCRALPQGLGLEGTKWQNYRLKATQTDWVDSFGEPTHVVNSKIEGGFIQRESSCISCHSLALIGEQGRTMPFSIVKTEQSDPDNRVANFVGVVKSTDRRPRPGIDPNGKFLQLDFVWSLRNAQPEN